MGGLSPSLAAAHPLENIGPVCIFIRRMFVVRDPLFKVYELACSSPVSMVTDMVVLFESIQPHMRTPRRPFPAPSPI